MKLNFPVRWLCALALFSIVASRPALAVEPSEIQPKALADLEIFGDKTSEGIKAFGQKKYAEAAALLAEGNAAYQRAARRDNNIEQLTLTTDGDPAFTYYGYHRDYNGNFALGITDKGQLQGSVGSFVRAANTLWQDAAILGGADKFPLGGSSGLYGDPTMVVNDQDHLDSAIRSLLQGPASATLPVRDEEWEGVVLRSRRAKLIVEYALQKYPAWKTEELQWKDGEMLTGDAILADLNARLAAAEPEWKDAATHLEAAEPNGFGAGLQADLENLDGVLKGINRDGYLPWDYFNPLFNTKDFVSQRRKIYAQSWTNQGKTMPAAKFKPLEDKVAAIEAAAAKNAARLAFPTGKPHDAAIEARVKSAMKSIFPNATVLKIALESDGWGIVKDEAQLPQYRQRAVLVLLKKPGEKWAWLISGNYIQDYAGGGTYNSAGKFMLGISARLQKAE